jgi:hypothetical protein
MDLPRLLARVALAGLDLALLGLALALLQAQSSPASLPLSLFGITIALLVGVVVTAVTGRWEQTRLQRILGMLGIVTAGLLLVKGGVGGGYGPLGGWSLFVAALRGQGSVYLALLLTLVAGWRGTRLRVLTVPAEVQQRFKRGLLVLVPLAFVAVLLPLADSAAARRAASSAVIGYVVAGLLAQALFRETSAERGDRRLSGRNVLILVAATGIPLILALALASLFAADVAAMIARAYTALVELLLIVISPIVAALFALLEGLIGWIRHLSGSAPPPQLPTPAPAPTLPESSSEAAVGLPAWLFALLGLLPYLLPLALLAIVLLRRPRRTLAEASSGEERESVWSWHAAGQDLQAWWQQLRRRLARPARDTLAAALARLRGDDPVTVIRRAYVRLLIRGGQADRARAPEQTPAEYAQALAPVFANDRDALALLTRTYEQARYHPAATTPADAVAAIHAWEQLAHAAALARKNRDEVTS